MADKIEQSFYSVECVPVSKSFALIEKEKKLDRKWKIGYVSLCKTKIEKYWRE